MRILRSRLYELERKKREEQRQKEEGAKRGIDFGSQIRSYVLHPYRQVKDLRTGLVSSQPQDVLDGDIDEFIRRFLLGEKSGTLGQRMAADD